MIDRGTPAAALMLEGLYQHRLLATDQLRALYTPGRSAEWARRVVLRLERSGLVASVLQAGRRKVFFLTADGVEAVQGAPTTESRRKQLNAEQAAGPLQRHTLAVNDVGIAFVTAARQRTGDVCGPLAWRHEIAHPVGPPPGRKRPEQVIADAVLTYERRKSTGAIRFEYRFVELDRNTMPTNVLADKLARYARLYRHAVKGPSGPVAFWQTRYPVFPTILLVMDNGTARQLERRSRTVLALCAEHPELRSTPEVEISCGQLADLHDCGPFAPIWRTVQAPSQPVGWLGDRW